MVVVQCCIICIVVSQTLNLINQIAFVWFNGKLLQIWIGYYFVLKLFLERTWKVLHLGLTWMMLFGYLGIVVRKNPLGGLERFYVKGWVLILVSNYSGEDYRYWAHRCWVIRRCGEARENCWFWTRRVMDGSFNEVACICYCFPSDFLRYPVIWLLYWL